MSVMSGSKYEQRAMQEKKQAADQIRRANKSVSAMVADMDNAHCEAPMSKASGEISFLVTEIDNQIEGLFGNVATMVDRIAPVLRKGNRGSAGLNGEGAVEEMSDLGLRLFSALGKLKHLNAQMEILHNSVAL